MKTLSIVIVNWNSGHQLRECLTSIATARADSWRLSAVTIVDNASTDDSMQGLPTGLPLHVVHNLDNKGFGYACNQGARVDVANYLLFLNPDARLYPDSLELPMQFMEQPANARVGICGIQLVDETGHVARSSTRFPSATGLALHALGIDRIVPRLGHFMTEWDHATSQPVDHVIGAFFLLRRPVFDAVGGFDERYFVYLEDLDVSFEASKRGWTSFYLADAQAFHAGGGTSRQIKARRLFYAIRSRILYAYKHFGWLSATAILLVTLFLEPLSRMAMGLLRGSLVTVQETWHAYAMLFSWCGKTLRQGRQA